MGLIDGRITQGFASEYNINSLVHCFIIHCHFYVPFPSFIQMNITILCVTRCPPSLLQVSNRFRLLSGNEGATSGSFSGGGKCSVRGRVPGRAVHLHLHLYPHTVLNQQEDLHVTWRQFETVSSSRLSLFLNITRVTSVPRGEVKGPNPA